jgi:tRNA nucleotidyltransferase/poly(A) polymerase
MNNYKKLINKYPILKLIGKISDNLGIKTYVVGGFIRDSIIKKKSKDIDIVCIGNSINLAEKIKNSIKKKKKVNIFKRFETAMIAFKK